MSPRKPRKIDVSKARKDELREYVLKMEKYSHDLEEEIEKLRERVITDEMTGLYTPTHFRQLVRNYLAGLRRDLINYRKEHDDFESFSEWCTFLMADLDGFKEINDNVGHEFGNDVLKMTAKIMKRVFHRPTDMVARYGGDEFAAMIQKTEPGKAKKLLERANRMGEYIKKRYLAHHGNAHTPEQREYINALSASVGLSGLNKEDFENIYMGAELDDYVSKLLQRADKHMYRIKRAKKSQS